ncbi:MAG: helix-turn-helix transcriptional regulator [Acidimicrobiales bacterium]
MSRISASQRVQRLLSLLPWVAANAGPSIDEVCARFGIGRAQLLDDLSLASMVGIYPYSPDALVEAVIEDDRVWVYYPLSFDRPLRLSAAEALALLAAGQVVLQAPGADRDGPLARGLAKVAGSLDVDPSSQVDVRLGSSATTVLERLDRAIRDRRQVEIDYYTYGRDELTTRVIEPYRLWTNLGTWYVVAWCHRAGGERQFRVDRVMRSEVLETPFAHDGEEPTVAAYEPRPDDPRVTIELPPDAGWVVEQYPLEAVDEVGEGRLRVTMAISGRPWLERLLLRLGPSARLVDQRGGADDLTTAAAEAARRLLARYAQNAG